MKLWLSAFVYSWFIAMGIFTGISFVKGGMDFVYSNFIPIAIGCGGLAFPGMLVGVLARISMSGDIK